MEPPSATNAAGEEVEEPDDPAEWPPQTWEVGYLCDARDKWGGWYEAKVLAIKDSRVRIHFQGWGRGDGSSKWDEWMQTEPLAKRLAPYQTKSAGGGDDDDDEDEIDPSVQSIVSVREGTGGVAEYKVKWIGADVAESWVPEDQIRDEHEAGEILDAFLEREKKKKAAADRKKLLPASTPTDPTAKLSLDEKNKVEMVVAVVAGTKTEDAISALKASRWNIEVAAERLLTRRPSKRPASVEEHNLQAVGAHQNSHSPKKSRKGKTSTSTGSENTGAGSEQAGEPMDTGTGDAVDNAGADGDGDGDGEEIDEDAEDDDEDDEDEAVPDRIVEKCTLEDGRPGYVVEWEGFPGEDEYTYEPADKVHSEEAFVAALQAYRLNPPSGDDESSEEEVVDDSWKPKAWEIGYLCDAQDQIRSPWCVGKVVELDPDNDQRFKIHFQGWSAKYDEWMDASCDRLAPHKTKSTKEAKAKAKAKAEARAARAERTAEEAKEKARKQKEAQKKQAAKEKEKAKRKEAAAKKRAKLKAQKLAEKTKKVADKKEKTPRALSAYNLYMKSELQAVKDSQPNLDHKEAFKQATLNWKQLGEEEAQRWKDLAAITRAKMEKDKFKPAVEDAQAKSKRKEKNAVGKERDNKRPAKKRAAAKGDEVAPKVSSPQENDTPREGSSAKSLNPKKRWKVQEQTKTNRDAEEKAEAEAEAEAERQQEAEEAERQVEIEARRKRKAEKRKIRLKKAAKNFPKDVLDTVYLRRTTLVHWLGAEDFASRVKGCLVRVAVATPDHQKNYQMGKIDGVFTFKSSPYSVDWKKTSQGLLVCRNGQKGVLKLETLSNLDCTAEELADVFEIMGDEPSMQLAARSEALQQLVCEKIVKEEIFKQKGLIDKWSATGNNKKQKEAIETREKLLKIQQAEDWALLDKQCPDLRPFPKSSAIKDDEVWEKLIPTLHIREDLAISPRIIKHPKAKGGEKRPRDDRRGSVGGRGRDQDSARGRKKSRNDGRDRGRDADRGRGRDKDRGRDRDRGWNRGGGGAREDPRLLQIDSTARAAPQAMANQGYSRDAAVVDLSKDDKGPPAHGSRGGGWTAGDPRNGRGSDSGGGGWDHPPADAGQTMAAAVDPMAALREADELVASLERQIKEQEAQVREQERQQRQQQQQQDEDLLRVQEELARVQAELARDQGPPPQRQQREHQLDQQHQRRQQPSPQQPQQHQHHQQSQQQQAHKQQQPQQPQQPPSQQQQQQQQRQQQRQPQPQPQPQQGWHSMGGPTGAPPGLVPPGLGPPGLGPAGVGYGGPAAGMQQRQEASGPRPTRMGGPMGGPMGGMVPPPWCDAAAASTATGADGAGSSTAGGVDYWQSRFYN
eukprot:SAG31_NODE_131_length_23419_cov_38.760087_7_plen_1353_part_00